MVLAHGQLYKMLNQFFILWITETVIAFMINWSFKNCSYKVTNFLGASFYDGLYFVKSKAVILYF
jgi:hypothetical protein